MLTLKFGGTSMGDADHIIDSANIIVERAEKDRLSVVASAVAGIYNSLQASIESCISGSSADNFVSDIKEKHLLREKAIRLWKKHSRRRFEKA